MGDMSGTGTRSVSWSGDTGVRGVLPYTDMGTVNLNLTSLSLGVLSRKSWNYNTGHIYHES